MKLTLIILSTFLCLKSFAHDCSYKNINEKRSYVIPIYVTEVDYIINHKTKSIMGKVVWRLNIDQTMECVEHLKEKMGNSTEILVAKLRMEPITVTFAEDKTVELSVFPEANGHWYGNTGFVKLPYSAKDLIEKNVKNKAATISLNGDVRYSMEVTDRVVVADLSCQSNAQTNGILAFISRIKDIRNELKTRPASENINQEEVLETFLGSCITFSSVDSKSLKEFRDLQRMSSKIINRSIPVFGDVTKSISQPLNLSVYEDVNILEVKN